MSDLRSAFHTCGVVAPIADGPAFWVSAGLRYHASRLLVAILLR